MAPGFSPLDETLGLLPRGYSPHLTQVIVRLGTWLPFAQVPEALAFLTGVSLSAETARRLTEQAGAALVALETAEVARIERELPASPAGPAVQQLSADGAMVPLVGGAWAEVRTLAIGTVEQRTGPDGQPVAHTTDLSYVSRLTTAAEFSRLALLATHRRGTERAGRVCAAMDGAPWLQELVALHRPDAVRILDFPHAAQYLSQAAQAVLGTSTPEASRWLEAQRQTLKAVRALPASGEAQAVRERVLGYVEPRRTQLRYADFQAQGYPIGSGIVESANKLVVEARLKGSGMHWSREQVNPMVALRGMACSGTWTATWPTLWRYLRRAGKERRPAHRPAAPLLPNAPAPSPPSAPPAASPQPKQVIDGRPTADHPWRSFRLKGSRPLRCRPQ